MSIIENNIESFIFVHDENIIIDYINAGKFNMLPNLKFVYLGSKSIDLILNIENVIIARDLEYNLEEFPKLTAFSGWYALWKNNLITKDCVILFEYDININTTFNCNDILNHDIIGYVGIKSNDIAYISTHLYSGNLSNVINTVHNFDIDKFKSLNIDVSVTSNHSFKTKSFNSFMTWVEPIIEMIKNEYSCGHQIERCISLFYLINNTFDVVIQNGDIIHLQLDSHETQGLRGKFINNYKNLI